MSDEVNIIEAYRSKQIPERFLLSSNPYVVGMFENQVMVRLGLKLSGSYNTSTIETYMRAVFMERLENWAKDFPTDEPWSVVNHCTTDDDQEEWFCLLGFIFTKREDSENFMDKFLMLDKLSN